MPANKTRRGRPKRMYDLVQEDEHQKHNSIASTSKLPDLDIRQPLTIYTQVDDICPEEKPCLVHLNQDIHLGSTTHAQINYDNLPQAVYLMNEPEDDDDPEFAPYIIQSEYIRYQEPTEDELFERVEYDMDERDQIWLNNYNEKNCADNDAPVSPELFEGLMDRLEKEWHRLIQGVSCPADLDSSSTEDSACAVCGDTEAENSNAIVFCDGCNLAVHQECYGIPHIPEGEWLCKQCQLAPDEDISCVFCPNKGGAFKQTTDGKWGHLLCAIWIPEVTLKDTVYMEPIDYVDKVPKGRLRLVCSICKQRQGACIQCDNKNCYSAFHVSCAIAAGYYMKIKLHEQGGIVMNAYCDKHMPKDTSEDMAEETPEDIFKDMPMEYEDSNEDDYTEHGEFSKKKGKQAQGRGRDRDRGHSSPKKIVLDLKTPIKKFLRAGGQHHVTGPPIAPNIILSRMDHIPRLLESPIRKKSQLVTAVSRYWSLKREYMKGAPLIKRLQLEPWAVTNYIAQANNVSGRHALAKKEFILDLWASLDKSRMLSEQVQRRERLKLEQLKKQKEYVEMYLYPNEYVFHTVLKQLIECDSNDYFKEPVSHEDAPDYASVIAEPMCFSVIQEKINCHEYTELDQLKRDVDLIWDNCVEYNLSSSDFYKTAHRLKKKSEAIFAWAEKKITPEELSTDSCTDSALDSPLDSELESSLNPVLDYNMFDRDVQEEEIDTADEEVIEIADDEDTELPVDGLVDLQPIMLPIESMEVTATNETPDIFSADNLPRRAGRRRIPKSTSENYTIIETGARQSTIKQWISHNSGKPAAKKKHKRETKKMLKPTAVQKEHGTPTVTSVDVGVQTDNYLLLSLLQEFKTTEALEKLAEEKQNDKELYNGLSLAKTVNQKIRKVTRNPLPKTLPEPIKVIGTDHDMDTISDNNSTDTEQEVIVTIKSPNRRRSAKLQKTESSGSSSPVMVPIKLPEACSSSEPQATESLETGSFNKPREVALPETSPAKPQATVSPEESFFGKSQTTNLPEKSSSVKPQRTTLPENISSGEPQKTGSSEEISSNKLQATISSEKDSSIKLQRTLLPGKSTSGKPQATESPKRNPYDKPLTERSLPIKPRETDSKEITSVRSQRISLTKKSTSNKSPVIESSEKSISDKPHTSDSTVDNSSVKPQRILLPAKGSFFKLQTTESTERSTPNKTQVSALMDSGSSVKPQATNAPERSQFVEPSATRLPQENSSTEIRLSRDPTSPKADLSPNCSMSYDITERSPSPVAPMENILAEPSDGQRTAPQSLEPVVSLNEGKRTRSSPKSQPTSKTVMRATRSRGLTANEEELKKRKRMSAEARILVNSLLHFENKEKPEEKYKTYYPKNAPIGWAYLESDDEDRTGYERTEETKAESRIKRRKIEQASLDDFNHNEIVWARVSGYPSHPAKLMKEVDENSSLYKSKRISQAVLVEFLKVPDNHKWGWILPNNITKFGATEVDKLKLAECLKEKGSARTSRIQEAREGYQYACSLIDKEDSESVIGSVFSEANLLAKKKPKSTKRK